MGSDDQVLFSEGSVPNNLTPLQSTSCQHKHRNGGKIRTCLYFNSSDFILNVAFPLINFNSTLKP